MHSPVPEAVEDLRRVAPYRPALLAQIHPWMIQSAVPALQVCFFPERSLVPKVYQADKVDQK